MSSEIKCSHSFAASQVEKRKLMRCQQKRANAIIANKSMNCLIKLFILKIERTLTLLLNRLVLSFILLNFNYGWKIVKTSIVLVFIGSYYLIGLLCSVFIFNNQIEFNLLDRISPFQADSDWELHEIIQQHCVFPSICIPSLLFWKRKKKNVFFLSILIWMNRIMMAK